MTASWSAQLIGVRFPISIANRHRSPLPAEAEVDSSCEHEPAAIDALRVGRRSVAERHRRQRDRLLVRATAACEAARS